MEGLRLVSLISQTFYSITLRLVVPIILLYLVSGVSEIQRFSFNILNQINVDRVSADVALHQRPEYYTSQGQELQLRLD
jgi:hypothetical protein